MGQAVEHIHGDPDDDGQDAELTVVDGPLFCDAQHQRLYYLLPVAAPGVRLTPTQRLRLQESLSGGAASHNANILARDPQFWNYLQEINLIAFEDEIDARRARQFINRVCGVTGRLALDRDPCAGQRFFRLVERPFLAWLCYGKRALP